MADFDFNVTSVPRSTSSMAEYRSVVQPLCGHVLMNETRYCGAVLGVSRMWRARLAALREDGWAAVQNPLRMSYARNCRPCCLAVDPPSRACNLRICPYCHGRWVAAVAAQMQSLVATARCHVRYISYSRVYKEDGIALDRDGQVRYLPEIFQTHRRVMERFRRLRCRSHTIGGCYWISIEPRMFRDGEQDGAVGLWHIRHSGMAIVLPEWKSFKTDGRLIVRELGTQLQTVNWISTALRYPVPWMRGSAPIVRQMCEQLAGKRTFSTFGAYRSRHEL